MDEKPTFTLAALEESNRYASQVDLLRVILSPDAVYTLEEVDALLAKELARPVVEEVNE